MPPVLVRSLDYRGGTRFVANVRLELRTESGPKVFPFRVDTGSELSVIGLEQALAAGLPVPDAKREVSRQVNGIDTRVRLGLLFVTFRIDATTVGAHGGALWTACAPFPPPQPVYSFEWECMFVVGRALTAPWLMGLGGRVLAHVDRRFRGAHRGFPRGTVELELLPDASAPTVPPA
jgi:hypothetical protein